MRTEKKYWSLVIGLGRKMVVIRVGMQVELWKMKDVLEMVFKMDFGQNGTKVETKK